MKTMWMTVMAGAVMAAAGFGAEVTARIPFDFEASGGHLAAGRYRISTTGSFAGGRILHLSSTDGKGSALMTSRLEGSAGPDRAELKFECLAKRCQLVEMRVDAAQVIRFGAGKAGDAKPEVRIVEFKR
ncbi:MAG: hypothetical protein K2Q23_16590 [Bryobacteraceae bacterium]|nr:hypothetical protein [Bryobacteraceae bacterium]